MVNQPQRMVFHYRYEPFGALWDFIKPHLELRRVADPPEWLRSYGYRDRLVKRYRYAHEADLIRLRALYDEGGVYADMDTLFIRRASPRLWDESCVLGQERPVWVDRIREHRGALCNAVIMAEPEAPLVGAWLREFRAEYDGSWSRHSCELARDLADRHPQMLSVEPSDSFYPFMWDRRDFQRLFEGLHLSGLESSCSIHLWAHLWWHRGRCEWSRFHGGMLNADYILNEETTFARLARPFMPPVEIIKRDSIWSRTVARLWPV